MTHNVVDLPNFYLHTLLLITSVEICVLSICKVQLPLLNTKLFSKIKGFLFDYERLFHDKMHWSR